jgi:hypothetical protein
MFRHAGQVHDRLEDLIDRLETVVKGDGRPVQLHWSDVETLRLIARERRELGQRVDALRLRLGGLLDEVMGASPRVNLEHPGQIQG